MDLKDRAIANLIEKSEALVAAVGAEADEKEELSNKHSLATSLAKLFKAKMDNCKECSKILAQVTECPSCRKEFVEFKFQCNHYLCSDCRFKLMEKDGITIGSCPTCNIKIRPYFYFSNHIFKFQQNAVIKCF